MSRVAVEPEVVSLPPDLARQFRRFSDRTQFEFARDAGVPYGRYVSFEQGRVQLSLAEVEKVLAALPLLSEALAAMPLLAQLQRHHADGPRDDA